jgi:hypothetical protein
MMASQPELIEFGNAAMSVIDLSLFATFAGYAVRSWRNGVGYKELKPAIAIGTFIFGAFITRFWSLLWVYGHNRDISVDWMNDYPAALFGLVTTVIGGLCVIRVFSPKSWSLAMWFSTLILAMLFAVVVRVS